MSHSENIKSLPPPPPPLGEGGRREVSTSKR